MLPVRLLIHHTASRVLHRYADWRIGATVSEKHCHKPSDSILLTFDDYGSDEAVLGILETLAQFDVKAMFFLEGSWAEKHQELTRCIADAGHIIGNHTYSHAVLLNLDDQAATDEIQRGVASKWLRPPEGRYNKRIRQLAAQLNFKICYWTIDSRDWTGAPVAEMQHTILSELHPGATILLHLHGKNTRELLRSVIPQILSRGYSLTSQSESW